MDRLWRLASPSSWGAAAVVVPLTVVDRTVEGTPVAAEIPFVDPGAPPLEPSAPVNPGAAFTGALPDDGLALETTDLYQAKDGACPLVIVSYAVFCADDPTVSDFLLSSLSVQGTAPTYAFPAGEWAVRLLALRQ